VRTRLHNEEPHNLYVSPSISRVIKSRRMRLVGYVARIPAMRNSCKNLVGKSKWKISLGNPRRRRKGNIKMDLREIRWEGVDWIIWLRTGTSGDPL